MEVRKDEEEKCISKEAISLYWIVKQNKICWSYQYNYPFEIKSS